MNKSQIVLLAEDNRGDVLLVQRAFRKVSSSWVLHTVEHGEAAVEYLAGKGEYSDRDRYPLPNLLLLDLKMPRKSGFEVMEWLQQQPSIQMPIVVLTTSSNPDEIDRAYDLGANKYLLKPLTTNMLSEILKSFNLDKEAGSTP